MKVVSGENGQWLSGRIGNVVGTSWKGIPCIRSAPKSRANESQAQLAQQTKFRLAVAFVRAFNGLWKISFETPGNQSAFNYMVSYTVMNSITGVYPDLSIDLKKILISHGRLPGVETVLVKAVDPGHVVFNWENNAGTGSARGDDFVILAIYEPEMRVAVFSTGSAMRFQEHAVLEAAQFAGRNLHCYLGFVNSRRTNVADSIYAGEVWMPEP